MRLAVVGAGGIAQAHLAAAAAHPGVAVRWLCDARLDVARHTAAMHGVPHVSTDAAEAIADEAVDAVIVALPTHLHAEWHLRAAAAGKHILTEKPLCRTMAQAEAVISACQRAGVRLAVGYQRRFSPARLRARELVRSGELGRPVTWTISSFGPRSDFYRGPGNWMWDLDKGAGMVMDGSIHDFDFAVWTLGMPVGLFAQSSRISDAVTAPTQAAAVIRFEQGDRLIYGASWQEGDFGTGGAPYTIVGPRGTILMDGEYAMTWHTASGETRRDTWDPHHLEPEGLGGVWLFYRQLDAFRRAVAGEAWDPSLACATEALGSLWIAESIIDAGPNGRSRRLGCCS